MPRCVKVAAAQMGPKQDGTPREAIVERMLTLLDGAAREDVELSRQPQHYGPLLQPVTEKEPNR